MISTLGVGATVKSMKSIRNAPVASYVAKVNVISAVVPGFVQNLISKFKSGEFCDLFHTPGILRILDAAVAVHAELSISRFNPVIVSAGLHAVPPV